MGFSIWWWWSMTDDKAVSAVLSSAPTTTWTLFGLPALACTFCTSFIQVQEDMLYPAHLLFLSVFCFKRNIYSCPPKKIRSFLLHNFFCLQWSNWKSSFQYQITSTNLCWWLTILSKKKNKKKIDKQGLLHIGIS